MSIFRKHKSIVRRAADDVARHKKKIERAIKESIKDIIAEESIIGQNGKKKNQSSRPRNQGIPVYLWK